MTIEYEVPEITVELGNITCEVYKGGNAEASDILSGKTAFVEGKLITGNIPVNSTSSIELTEVSPLTVETEANYMKNNLVILPNFNTTASELDILDGKTAVCGTELITGTIPSQSAEQYELTTNPLIIPSKGKYYKDNITVTADLKTGNEALIQDITNTIEKIDLDTLSKEYYAETGTRLFSVRNYAFAGITCNSVTLPQYAASSGNRQISLGKYAFAYSNFSTLNFNSSYPTLIDSYAFYQNTGLQKINSSKICSIGNYAFRGCTALETISLKGIVNTQSIGTYAFADNTETTNIELSNFGTINAYAFNKNLALKQINLGNVTSLGNYVFGTGTSANSPQDFNIIISSTTPPTITTTTFGNLTSATNTMQPKIYVPDDSYDTYCKATNWSAVNTKWGIHKMSELD